MCLARCLLATQARQRHGSDMPILPVTDYLRNMQAFSMPRISLQHRQIKACEWHWSRAPIYVDILARQIPAQYNDDALL